jgi:hypothetical protein
MGYQYLRALQLLDSDAWRRVLPKVVCLFLKECCGWTVTESVASGSQSFISTEKGGSDGRFDGTDWILTADSTTPFLATDVGKLIVLVAPDSTVLTSGVYRIKDFVSTNEIKIDYRANPSSEFPPDNTAGTPITYKVFAYTFEAPSTNGDYWRAESPHSTSWALQWNYQGTNEAYIYVAVDGDWGGGKLLGGNAGTANDLNFRISGAQDRSLIDVIVEDSGEFLLVSNHAYDDDSFNDYRAQQAFMVNKLTPMPDLSLADEECIALFGSRNTNDSAFWRRDYSYVDYVMSSGRVWSNSYGDYLRCHVSDLSYFRGNQSLATRSSWANSYRDTNVEEYDIIGHLVNYKGEVVKTTDNTNNSLKLRVLGTTQHYLVIPPIHVRYGASSTNIDAQTTSYPPRTLSLASATAKDYLAIQKYAFPYCGLSRPIY